MLSTPGTDPQRYSATAPLLAAFAALSLLACAGTDEDSQPFEPRGGSGSEPRAGGGSGSLGGTPATGGSASVAGTAAGTGQGGSSVPTAGSAGRGGSAGSASSCTGKSGQRRGRSNQNVMAGGLQRTFIHYAPESLDPNVPAPIVIVAHGWTMASETIADITRYDELAEREKFVVLYPDGQPASIGPWNVGEGACPSNLLVLPVGTGDDQAFVDAMIDFAETDQCVDRKHVFVTGFSMGGYFSNETGCLRSEVAAIGPHSGGSHDLASCPITRKPAILFHGLSDGLIPVTCGREARDRWVARNGCSAEVDTEPVMGGSCEYSRGCPADGQVVLCLFDGMGHGWAGGTESSFGFPEYESASELGWKFFKQYAW